MRKSMIIAAGLALLLAAMASAKPAGSGPRLNGSFSIASTIEANDIGIAPGTQSTDVYKFKSPCPAGGCAKVTLIRKSGGRNFKSTLKKTSPGVYKGTEGPSPYTCVTPLGTLGQFTAENKITVTKARKGVATKISGEIKIHITGCTETFENAKLTGKAMG